MSTKRPSDRELDNECYDAEIAKWMGGAREGFAPSANLGHAMEVLKEFRRRESKEAPNFRWAIYDDGQLRGWRGEIHCGTRFIAFSKGKTLAEAIARTMDAFLGSVEVRDIYDDRRDGGKRFDEYADTTVAPETDAAEWEARYCIMRKNNAELHREAALNLTAMAAAARALSHYADGPDGQPAAKALQALQLAANKAIAH